MAQPLRPAFEIGGHKIQPGSRQLVDLPVSKLSNHTPVTLPVHVLHGPRPGPAMFVSAAIHGDELNGVEIIRRVLRTLQPGNISGTLLCVPVVNAYGFIGRSRYLPDRRDLNRAFPGSPDGSLAARLASLFLKEVVKRCQFGIDLHTAAVHRVNLPQIRADFRTRPRCRELSEAFGAQVVLESPERAGSLRRAAREVGVDVLVYEGGEGLRFDEFAIKAGVDGIANVMLRSGMLELPDGVEPSTRTEQGRTPVFANASKWVRAPDGGIFRTLKKIGQAVSEGETIGWVANPYDDTQREIRSPRRGIIIGSTTLPIVNMGDALFHVAWSEEHDRAKPGRDAARDRDPASDPVMDEDEII
ncbi:MAG TPA: succinylglutamate desuccinylase/aspartoacylase family protein [Hyphomicrobiaceae bacterium]|jgi:predicted deacylase|nr:succinylglutamate desuccinylase/aspartoacylase family protein [Hyphomicrobiaceae bacterium]